MIKNILRTLFPGMGRGEEEREPEKRYDPERQKPAIRCSICTGEQVAGFLDLRSRKFLEIQLIQRPEDLEKFKKEYGITEEVEKFF